MAAVLFIAIASPAARAQLFEEAVSGAETDDDAQQADEEAGPFSCWNADLNGHVRGDLFIGKEVGESAADIKNAYAELGLKLRLTGPEWIDLFGEARLKFGVLDTEYLGRPTDADPHFLDFGEVAGEISLRELYTNFYLGPLDLRIGQQIIMWGRADGINPTNNLTPVDLRVRSPEEDDRRMGNLALRANLNLAPIRVEGVFVPFYLPSYLPKVEMIDGIDFEEPTYDRWQWNANTMILAGRVHLLLPAFEASLSYLHGGAVAPGMGVDDYYLDNDAPSTLWLQRSNYSHHVIGADFETAIGEFMGLRGEIAYRLPDKYDKAFSLDDPDFYHTDRTHVPNPDLYYVLGADKEFGNVSVIAQYIGRYVLNWESPPELATLVEEVYGQDLSIYLDDFTDIDSIPAFLGDVEGMMPLIFNHQLFAYNRLIYGQSKAVQHGASLRLEWRTLHDQLSLVGFGMMNFTTKEWLVYPKVAYFATDALTVTLGAEIYRGPENTLFNMIEEVLTAGYAELKLSF